MTMEFVMVQKYGIEDFAAAVNKFVVANPNNKLIGQPFHADGFYTVAMWVWRPG